MLGNALRLSLELLCPLVALAKSLLTHGVELLELKLATLGFLFNRLLPRREAVMQGLLSLSRLGLEHPQLFVDDAQCLDHCLLLCDCFRFNWQLQLYVLRLPYAKVNLKQICQGLLLRGHLSNLALLLGVWPQGPHGDHLVRLLTDVANALDRFVDSLAEPWLVGRL